MAFLHSMCARMSTAHITGAGTKYLVKTPSGVFYIVYIDSNLDVSFVKSTDGGATWSSPTVVFAGSATQLSIWYDRWSNISAGLIHCAYTDSGNDDTMYRSIDTENSDALSTETTVFAGASTAGGGALSIVRARGGNLYVKVCIDAGAEGGFFRSTDVGATWGSRTDSEALATTDQWILMPGWAADNQDIMMFFWDASADEISRVLHDDSGNSWAETSIATSMVDVAASTRFPNFAATVDITNSRNLLCAWSANDTLNADLRVWHVTESAITEVTNVVTNSTDDQALCGITIDTDTEDWYAFYTGLTDGSETVGGQINMYYKKSTDDGATWGSETKHTVGGVSSIIHFIANPRSDGFPEVLYAIFVSGVATDVPQVLIADYTAPAGGSGGVSRARSNAGVGLC